MREAVPEEETEAGLRRAGHVVHAARRRRGVVHAEQVAARQHRLHACDQHGAGSALHAASAPHKGQARFALRAEARGRWKVARGRWKLVEGGRWPVEGGSSWKVEGGPWKVDARGRWVTARPYRRRHAARHRRLQGDGAAAVSAAAAISAATANVPAAANIPAAAAAAAVKERLRPWLPACSRLRGAARASARCGARREEVAGQQLLLACNQKQSEAIRRSGRPAAAARLRAGTRGDQLWNFGRDQK